MFGFDADMLYRIPALLAALTIHEYAHARVAVAMGDPTPKFLGRLTLNPIKHLDLVGSILMIATGFGWAKPVPINPYNFRNQRKGLLAVSLAGVVANIVLSFVALVVWILLEKFALIGHVWATVLRSLYTYNIMFAVFNLIPVPPLDGSKVLASLLPGRWAYEFERIEPYGPYILIALVAFGVVGTITYPIRVALSMIFSAAIRLFF